MTKRGTVIATIRLKVFAIKPEDMDKITRKRMSALDEWLSRHLLDIQQIAASQLDDVEYVVGMKIEDVE